MWVTQETFNRNRTPKIKKGFGRPNVWCFHVAEEKKRGVAIFFNKNVYYTKEETIQDNADRYVMVVGSIAGVKITVLNIYFAK